MVPRGPKMVPAWSQHGPNKAARGSKTTEDSPRGPDMGPRSPKVPFCEMEGELRT